MYVPCVSGTYFFRYATMGRKSAPFPLRHSSFVSVLAYLDLGDRERRCFLDNHPGAEKLSVVVTWASKPLQTPKLST